MRPRGRRLVGGVLQFEGAKDKDDGKINRTDHQDDGDDEIKDEERRVALGLFLALEEVHARES